MPLACPACWCSVGSAPPRETVRAVVGERPNYIAADLRSLYDRADLLRVGPHQAWRIEIGEAAVTIHNTGSRAEGLADGGAGHRERGVELEPHRPAVRDRRRRLRRPKGTGAVVPADVTRSTSVNPDMSTEPDEIRARIAALLADLPDVEGAASADVDIDSLAAKLEEAHDLLVYALESVEKGPAATETPDG